VRLVSWATVAAMRGCEVYRTALQALAAAALLLLAGCSSGKFVPVPGDANGGLHLQEDCDNPLWKQQNLGLWYSLCRKPLPL
jgi:hypothetical protein